MAEIQAELGGVSRCWVQRLLSATKGDRVRIRECRRCRLPFETTKKRALYCGPPCRKFKRDAKSVSMLVGPELWEAVGGGRELTGSAVVEVLREYANQKGE